MIRLRYIVKFEFNNTKKIYCMMEAYNYRWSQMVIK